MRLLDEIELMLTEEKDSYTIYPLDYDLEAGVSFGVDYIDDDDSPVAKVKIKTMDGVPIDALNGNYNYDDVYADVSIEGDTKDPKNADLMLWVLKKLKNMGYDEQSIRIDGDVYYKKPENLSDIISTDDNKQTPAQTDTYFDPSKYWATDDDEDEDSDSDYQPPSAPKDTSNDEEDEDEEVDDSSDTSDEEDEEDEDDDEENTSTKVK